MDINPTDDKAKIAVERTLKSLMDWVRITDAEWVVLANRHTAATLQDKIKKIFQSKDSKVFVKDAKKARIDNDGYIDAKNGEASEILFTSKH